MSHLRNRLQERTRFGYEFPLNSTNYTKETEEGILVFTKPALNWPERAKQILIGQDSGYIDTAFMGIALVRAEKQVVAYNPRLEVPAENVCLWDDDYGSKYELYPDCYKPISLQEGNNVYILYTSKIFGACCTETKGSKEMYVFQRLNLFVANLEDGAFTYKPLDVIWQNEKDRNAFPAIKVENIHDKPALVVYGGIKDKTRPHYLNTATEELLSEYGGIFETRLVARGSSTDVRSL